MKPISPFENYPSFANGGSRSAPGDAKYALGFVAADTFPAEWANYFFHGATKGISDLNSAVYSMWNEMGSVLSNFNITPDASDNDQLLEALTKLKAEAALAAHPVGSLYWTSSSENPATTFGGGTWKQIKDRFILSAGDTYTNGNTGGSATVTLTANQIPSHTHSFTPSGSVTVGSHTHTFTPSGEVGTHSHNVKAAGTVSSTFTGTAVTSGKGSAHSHGLNSHTHSLSSHTHNFEHKHTTGGMSANESGTLTAGGTYGGNDRSAFISSTGNMTLSESSNKGFDYASNMTGYRKMTLSVAHTHTTNSLTNSSGTAITNTGGPSVANTGAASGNTADESAHTHSVTAAGTVSSTFTGIDTASGSTKPTFTGTAGTTGGTAPTGSFTGTAGTTGGTGGGGSHDNMPPYIVKYCWERTA